MSRHLEFWHSESDLDFEPHDGIESDSITGHEARFFQIISWILVRPDLRTLVSQARITNCFAKRNSGVGKRRDFPRPSRSLDRTEFALFAHVPPRNTRVSNRFTQHTHSVTFHLRNLGPLQIPVGAGKSR